MVWTGLKSDRKRNLKRWPSAAWIIPVPNTGLWRWDLLSECCNILPVSTKLTVDPTLLTKLESNSKQARNKIQMLAIAGWPGLLSRLSLNWFGFSQLLLNLRLLSGPNSVGNGSDQSERGLVGLWTRSDLTQTDWIWSQLMNRVGLVWNKHKL